MLNFDGARKLKAPTGAVVVLAHADGTPLLYTCSAAGRAAVIFNFDPAREDFFLSPWFPVFVHDAAVLLTGRENTFPSAVATGSRIQVPGTEKTGSASFKSGPNKRSLPYATPFAINRIGNYSFTRNTTNWHLGGAVFSVGESGPAPAGASKPSVQPRSGWSFATWLLLAAVIAVLAEELLYHRRKVG